MEDTAFDDVSNSVEHTQAEVKYHNDSDLENIILEFHRDKKTSPKERHSSNADNDPVILNISFEILETSWEEMYSKFKNSLSNSISSRDHEITDWLNRQILNRKSLSENQYQKLNSLGVHWDTVFSRDHAWQIMFSRLEGYKNNHSHCRVPSHWEKDKQLALWVRRQRQLYSQNKIQEYRKRLLNQIGFTWKAQDLYETQWDECFSKLIDFHEKHGHFSIPYTDEALVGWVERQRLAKKKNKLSTNRTKRLDKIGFIWEYDQIKESEWNKRFNQLVDFNKKFGHSFVPTNYKTDKSLGNWVALQRQNEKQGKLSQKKYEKLDNIGFVWGSDTKIKMDEEYADIWKDSFEKLKRYKLIHGTCQVSLKDDPLLQSWTAWQRKMYFENRLSMQRIKELESISFPWDINEGYWLMMSDQLREFYNLFGHSKVPSQWSENPKLAAWTYRIKANKEQLSKEKIKLLDSLSFDWAIKKKIVVKWSGMYCRLLQFKKRFGHTRVPVKWGEDLKLGKWVSKQRSERHKLYEERRFLLDLISFHW